MFTNIDKEAVCWVLTDFEAYCAVEEQIENTGTEAIQSFLEEGKSYTPRLDLES